MATTEDVLKKELDELRIDLIKAYDEKGMRASGQWAESLEIETTKGSGKLTGLKYSEQLEYGRRAGGFPPIAKIEQWIKDKGIRAIESRMTDRTLAFLIARKIANQGWDRSGFGGVELITEVVTPDRIQKIIDKISEAEILNVTSDITRLIENLNFN